MKWCATYFATFLDAVWDWLDADDLAEVVPRVDIIPVDTVVKVELLNERVLEGVARVCALRRVPCPTRRFAQTFKVLLGRGRWLVGEPGGGEPCEEDLEGCFWRGRFWAVCVAHDGRGLRRVGLWVGGLRRDVI